MPPKLRLKSKRLRVKKGGFEKKLCAGMMPNAGCEMPLIASFL